MKGWMKFRHKGGLANRLAGLRSEHRLYFVLTEECMLNGYNDEASLNNQKVEVSFDIGNAAITTNQERTDQFEITADNGLHLLFTVKTASEVLNWISSIQLQRSLNLQTSTSTSPPNSSSHQKASENKFRKNSRSEKLNGEVVSNHPLSSPASSALGNLEFEWDNDIEPPSSPQRSHSSESSSVFQFTEEISNLKQELDQCRLKIQSYQEVLALRDQQLFRIRDELSNQEFHESQHNTWNVLEEQVRSYREQNAFLNEEVLKLHQMHNKSAAEAKIQTRRADKLASELRATQRDYLAALSGCIRRPLVDPDDGAYFDIPDRDRHISRLKVLSREIKSKNNRILGCPVPSLGKNEHIDAFSFIHSLPNEALQIQYLCHHLYEAYTVLMETDDENQKNLRKWKSCIMDGSREFELTPQLRKLVQHGVPNQYRAYLWQKLINYYVVDLRKTCEENYFNNLLNRPKVSLEDKNFNKYTKQIAIDVPRTMPNNKDYLVTDSVHKERLSNVLTALCVHSPAIGYCQGFNFLAGGCLLFLEEEDAFWFLVAVTEKIFPPDYYRNGLAGLLADQYVLQEIITNNMPKLSEHLAKFPEVDLAAVTTGWFLGLFFDCLPFQTLIRVWDCFLAFGHEAMFRVAYAMFKLFEDRLVELNEPSQLLHAAKNIPKLCTHPGQLIKMAFNVNFPRWEEIETMRFHCETNLIENHEKKMQQRRFYDQRLLLFEEDESLQRGIPDDKWNFNSGAAYGDKFFLCASCPLNDYSQLYELETHFIRQLRFPITSHVMCVSIVSDDVVLVGLLTGQIQAYSNWTSSLLWSMSLSDVVLCMLVRDREIYVGTSDGKLHFLDIVDAEPSKLCAVKPSHSDSIELSKRPTTCFSYIEEHKSLWVASGPAIYVVNVETNETDGFFLVSSRIEKVSSMLHWSRYVLIAVRGSSIIQLHGTEVFNDPPLLVYDVARQMMLSPLYPMMPDEGDPKSPSNSVVVCMVHVSGDVFWLGTAGGDVLMYALKTSDVETSSVPAKTTQAAEGDGFSSFSFRLMKSEHTSNHPVRCLLKSESRITSCAGYYTEENSIRVWNLAGTLAIPEVTISASSSSEMLEEGKSLASSSRSLDGDYRVQKSDGATTETWKSVKSAAASAMKNLEKKPRIRRLMNMWGPAGAGGN